MKAIKASCTQIWYQNIYGGTSGGTRRWARNSRAVRLRPDDVWKIAGSMPQPMVLQYLTTVVTYSVITGAVDAGHLERFFRSDNMKTNSLACKS